MQREWTPTGRGNQAWKIAGGSLLLLIALVWFLMRAAEGTSPVAQRNSTAHSAANSDSGRPADDAVVVYCAAGLKLPVEAAAKLYAQERFGRPIHLQYGGSGTLLSNLRVAKQGDLFIAADRTYLELAREQGLIAETIPLAQMRPVVAVRQGNPKSIHTIDDLMRDDVKLALANPEAASIGRITRQLFSEAGLWDRLAETVKVFKPTVNDVANDVLLGAVDAAIIWDATARQNPEQLEIVSLPIFDDDRASNEVTLGVLRWTRQPAATLHFARYLQAPEKGAIEFANHGFIPVEGDAWADTPTINLFSGGVNRLAVQDTLRQFEAREGVRINVVYNGCGILVSMIEGGQRPDAYFACDTSYMTQVQSRFQPSLNISETDMIIITQPGNPHDLKTVFDLRREGLKLGIANEEQSALGSLTRTLLEGFQGDDDQNLYEAIQPNIATRTPTADLLVNQLRTGALDAAIVYRANVPLVLDKLEVIPIADSRAIALQPIAGSYDSSCRYLTGRLIDAVRSNESRALFEKMGFRWRAEATRP